jgi:hypothetical protein
VIAFNHSLVSVLFSMNPICAITETALTELRGVFSGEILTGAGEELLRHAYDWWPIAAMWRKQGKTPHLPEAVCFPKSKADALVLLGWATKHKVAVTPWGRGLRSPARPCPGTVGSPWIFRG